MALIGFNGFELGPADPTTSHEDIINFATGTGTCEIQSTRKRSGDYALHIGHVAGQSENYRGTIAHGTGGAPTALAETDLYYSFWVQFTAFPTSANQNFFFVVDGSNQIVNRLGLNASGLLTQTGATTVSTDLSLTLNKWHHIEIHIISNSTSTVRLDGTESALTNTANNLTQSRYQFAGAAGGEAWDAYFDDLVFDDADWVSTTMGAEAGVWRLDIDGEGATSTFTTGGFGDMDETPHDGDTTFVASATSGQVEMGTCETVANATGSAAFAAAVTIRGVKNHAIVRDEAGASAVQLRLTADGMSDDTASDDPGSAYVHRAKVYTQTPNATAWTETLLNAAECGVENNANVAMRCTQSVLTFLVSDSLLEGSGGTRPEVEMENVTTYEGDYGKQYTGSAEVELSSDFQSKYAFRPVGFILRDGYSRGDDEPIELRG